MGSAVGQSVFAKHSTQPLVGTARNTIMIAVAHRIGRTILIGQTLLAIAALRIANRIRHATIRIHRALHALRRHRIAQRLPSGTIRRRKTTHTRSRHRIAQRSIAVCTVIIPHTSVAARMILRETSLARRAIGI